MVNNFHHWYRPVLDLCAMIPVKVKFCPFAIGTAMYRASELWQTRNSPSTAADVWSMALTLLKVMTSKIEHHYTFRFCGHP